MDLAGLAEAARCREISRCRRRRRSFEAGEEGEGQGEERAEMTGEEGRESSERSGSVEKSEEKC